MCGANSLCPIVSQFGNRRLIGNRESVIHQHRKTCIAWFNEVMLQKSLNATDWLKRIQLCEYN